MPIAYSSELEDNIESTKQKMMIRSRENLLNATIEWHDSLTNDVLTGSRTGRVYTVPGTKRRYRASAPGEPPASRTGVTRAGYRYQVVRRKFELTGEVGSPEWHALWLEKGTKRMAARPHVKPAFEKRREQILGHLGKRWDQ